MSMALPKSTKIFTILPKTGLSLTPRLQRLNLPINIILIVGIIVMRFSKMKLGDFRLKGKVSQIYGNKEEEEEVEEGGERA